MPINQYRMINLLDASEDCLAVLAKLLAGLEGVLAQVRAGQTTDREALLQINEIARLPALSRLKIETIQTLANERNHFSPARIRFNDRVRDKQARRRGSPDIPQNLFRGRAIGTPTNLPPAHEPTSRTKDDSEGIISPDEDLFDLEDS